MLLKTRSDTAFVVVRLVLTKSRLIVTTNIWIESWTLWRRPSRVSRIPLNMEDPLC